MIKKISLLIVCLCASSCGFNFSGNLYELGKSHEVYTLPAGEKLHVVEVDGKHYVKGEKKSYEKKYDNPYFINGPEKYFFTYKYVVKSESPQQDYFVRVDVEKRKWRHKLTVTDEIILADEFKGKQSQVEGRFIIAKPYMRQDDEYLKETGQSERLWTAYPAWILFPVTVSVDFCGTLIGWVCRHSAPIDLPYDITEDHDEFEWYMDKEESWKKRQAKHRKK